MNITVDQIMDWKPCERWPRERIEKIMGGTSMSLEKILVDPDIPRSDRIWVGCYAFPRTVWTWAGRAKSYATRARDSVVAAEVDLAARRAQECFQGWGDASGRPTYAASLFAGDAAVAVGGWEGYDEELEAQLDILIQLAKEGEQP
jgi:hypothetical protein